MFGWNAGRQKRAAALSLRGTSACYAELERAGEAWRLANARVIELPFGCVSGGHVVDGARLGAFLRAKLRFCWKNLPLVVGIPSADCVFQLIDLCAGSLSAISRFRMTKPCSTSAKFVLQCKKRPNSA